MGFFRSSGVLPRPWLWTLSLAILGASLVEASARAQEAEGGTGVEVRQDATVESLFKDFLQYAKLGRFKAADAFAQALLNRSDLDPRALLKIAEQEPRSMQTLLILVENSTVGERAVRVIELIERGEVLERKDPERIARNIQLLGGDPQQEYNAIRHLIESGEYAIPPMVETLLNDDLRNLHRRVITALPKIGHGAVNPLVQALSVKDESVRLELIRALGEIGYPQAFPYLLKVAGTPNMPERSVEAARRAIARIESLSGRGTPATAPEAFELLANRYYDEDSDVAADPRLDNANVWYWDATSQRLKAVVVETKIFGPVMAMRCGEEALRLAPDRPHSIALWLAANIRREGRLGMDVESGDPSEAGRPDATRPVDFPRALYFSQAAGPRYAHMVLARAVSDKDDKVALGAIRALRITAGPSSLIGSEDYKQPLVEALRFPNLKVRIRAALALGAALPTTTFAGSDLVIPVLSEALSRTGKNQILVVDADAENLNRVMGALRDGDTDVVGEASFYTAMQRARREFEYCSAIYLATNLADPDLATAIAELRKEFRFNKTPVVILTKPDQDLLAEEITSLDPNTARVDAGVDGSALKAAQARIMEATEQVSMSSDEALAMALEAAEVLRDIAVYGRTVYDFSRSEPALIGALSSTHEELQIKSASVLALAPTATAQRSIAHLALDEGNAESLRVSCFASLAESAKVGGNHLEDAQAKRLLMIAKEDANLTIRTAASRALGALNIATDEASAIIRSFYGG